MLTGFKNFLMRGDIVTVAVGLAVALAFSALIAAFTSNIINPIVSRFEGNNSVGLGVQLGSPKNKATFLNFGGLISAIIYFIIFMLVPPRPAYAALIAAGAFYIALFGPREPKTVEI